MQGIWSSDSWQVQVELFYMAEEERKRDAARLKQEQAKTKEAVKVIREEPLQAKL